jgi:hypothetical protein
MEIEQIASCCGIGEMADLDSSAVGNMYMFCESETPYSNDRYNLYVFTDAVYNRRGSKLAAYIIRNQLGTITASPRRIGHSGRNVQLWIWSVDWDKMEEWAKKHNCFRLEDGDDGYNW